MRSRATVYSVKMLAAIQLIVFLANTFFFLPISAFLFFDALASERNATPELTCVLLALLVEAVFLGLESLVLVLRSAATLLLPLKDRLKNPPKEEHPYG